MKFHMPTVSCHCGLTRVPIGNRRYLDGMTHTGLRDASCFPSDPNGRATTARVS